MPTNLPAPRAPLDIELLVQRTAALLRHGIPLTLLLDLGEPDGPRSAAIYAAEGGRAWTEQACTAEAWDDPAARELTLAVRA